MLKETNHKTLHTIIFHLYETQEKAKTIVTKSKRVIVMYRRWEKGTPTEGHKGTSWGDKMCCCEHVYRSFYVNMCLLSPGYIPRSGIAGLPLNPTCARIFEALYHACGAAYTTHLPELITWHT